MAEKGEPSGPMQNGTTYIVRPCIEPLNRPSSLWRISPGSTQLLVGPASAFLAEQMKVRLSTRATSFGSELAAKEFGRFFKGFIVPAATSSPVSLVHSASEPSHQTTWLGCVK